MGYTFSMTVEFDEPASVMSVRGEKRPSFLSRMVMKLGLAKTPGGAQFILFIIGLILIITAAFQYVRTNRQPAPLTPAQAHLNI